MTRRWAVFGAGVGITLGVAVHAPAVWLADPLARATGSHLHLIDARGTVWQGEGRLQVGRGASDAGARLLPGRLSWSWGWDSGALSLAVRADCCAAQGQRIRLVPGWDRLTLQLADGSSQWPAAVLAGLGAPWNTVQAEGELRLQTRGLSVEWSGAGMQWRGQLQADALAVASRLSTLRPVGSYRLTLSAPDAGTPSALQLLTLEGPLRLEGSGQWTGTRWRFRGEASAEPPSEAALANLLNMLGRRQGSKSVLAWG